MRFAFIVMLAAVCGCSKGDKFDYAVFRMERPYIAKCFDRDGLAKVECGRFTGWREEFYIGKEKVSRKEYFTHLQKNIGWRLAGICAQEKATGGRHVDEYSHVEHCVARAIEFWETKKNTIDSPERNLEEYKEGLRR